MDKVKAEKTIEQFDVLKMALIDASSVIYMMKSGFFQEAASTVDLYSLPEIIAETGQCLNKRLFFSTCDRGQRCEL